MNMTFRLSSIIWIICGIIIFFDGIKDSMLLIILEVVFIDIVVVKKLK